MLFTLHCLSLAAASVANPVVSIPGLGKVEGRASNATDTVSFFGGIPYGKAPVDELRWQAPVAYGEWGRDHPWDGTSFGTRCAQLITITPHDTPAGEDCLFLNVFVKASAVSGNDAAGIPPGARTLAQGKHRTNTSTPALDKMPQQALLPVMVWIHGGAYMTGESNEYTGDTLVQASNLSVIVVTINYRLNVFGFLGSADLQKRSADGTTGNFGIQDQRLAIAWVKDHIAAFGGDGDDITIFGESAGGNSVINHLAQPASFPLYNKAIVESGAYDYGGTTLDAAEVVYQAVMKKAGCTNLACLQALSTEQLLAATFVGEHWGPVVDGKALPAAPIDLISQGKYNNKVPIVIGSNRDEMAFFSILEAVPKDLTQVGFGLLLPKTLNSTQKDQVTKIYKPGGAYQYPADLGPYSSWWWAYTRVVTDLVPGLGPCAVRWLSRMFVAGGTPELFVYFFAHPTVCDAEAYPAECASLEAAIPGITSGPKSYVVPHASEINYVFGSTKLFPPGSEQVDLANSMAAYWATFGRTGNPNLKGLPEWPSYTVEENHDTLLRFDVASAGGVAVESHVREAACDWMDANML